MTRKSDQTHVDALVQAQLRFLEARDPTDPWKGGEATAQPPINGLLFRLYPHALDRLLDQLAPTMTPGQKTQTASNLTQILVKPGLRKGLAERGVFGQTIAMVYKHVWNGSHAWSAAGILDIDRMRKMSMLIKDVAALGQLARDCPTWFPRALGDDNTRAAVTRNLLVFLQREILDLRKKQRKTPVAMEQPNKLHNVAQVLFASLPLLNPDEVGAWLTPACTVAGHLHVYEVEVPPTHCQYPMDQVPGQDPLVQDGLAVLRRAVLQQSVAERTQRNATTARRRM